MLKQRPLSDRIIIKLLEEEHKDGLYIPKNELPKGEVVAIGRGKLGYNDTPIPVEPKIGDVVMFGKHSGTEITIDEEEYLIMKESDILLIL